MWGPNHNVPAAQSNATVARLFVHLFTASSLPLLSPLPSFYQTPLPPYFLLLPLPSPSVLPPLAGAPSSPPITLKVAAAGGRSSRAGRQPAGTTAPLRATALRGTTRVQPQRPEPGAMMPRAATVPAMAATVLAGGTEDTAVLPPLLLLLL